VEKQVTQQLWHVWQQMAWLDRKTGKVEQAGEWLADRMSQQKLLAGRCS